MKKVNTFSGIKYFKQSEFDSPDVIKSGGNMDVDFIYRLDQAREIAGIPFVINSGYRTPAHNKEEGGVEDSSHLKGKAADIKATNSNQRALIVKSLIQVGFNRIGIDNGYVHVDNDLSKPENVFWLYD